jgi:protoporphyrinogen oxidase
LPNTLGFDLYDPKALVLNNWVACRLVSTGQAYPLGGIAVQTLSSRHGDTTDPILIVGAGLTGLSTAFHLEKRGFKNYRLIEAEGVPGGWARTDWGGEYGADRGGHVLYFRNDRIRDWVSHLIGGDWTLFDKHCLIDSGGVRTPFPFHANLHGRPPEVVESCLAGLRQAIARGGLKESPATFEEWNLQHFGSGVNVHFMHPYNSKMWTVPPSEMDSHWMGNFIPTVSWQRVVAGARRSLDGRIGLNSTFYYPKRGLSILAEALASEVSRIEYNIALVDVIATDNTAILSDGTEQKYSHLICTLPLKTLGSMLRSPSLAAHPALKRLEAVDLLLADVGFRGPEVSDVHWVYFPDPEVLGFRLQLLHALSPELAPAGHGLYCLEISHSRHRPLPTGDLRHRIISDLIRLGWLRSEDQVTFYRERRLRDAYILPRVGFQKDAAALKDELDQLAIISVGRYGDWKYSNMEDALLDGARTAERILSRSAKRAAHLAGVL